MKEFGIPLSPKIRIVGKELQCHLQGGPLIHKHQMRPKKEAGNDAEVTQIEARLLTYTKEQKKK